MLLLEQLLFFFSGSKSSGPTEPKIAETKTRRGRDVALEARARRMLHHIGADQLVPLVRVEWSNRLRSTAGRAVFQHSLVSLNPRLSEHGTEEIERTLRHELAHLVAQVRAGRRRIAPHGVEWRRACRDLGIANEQRCHTLPFPTKTRPRRYLYRCPRCATDFPRVRLIRRSVACLACCRKFNRGRYDQNFRLQLVRRRGRV